MPITIASVSALMPCACSHSFLLSQTEAAATNAASSKPGNMFASELPPGA